MWDVPFKDIITCPGVLVIVIVCGSTSDPDFCDLCGRWSCKMQVKRVLEVFTISILRMQDYVLYSWCFLLFDLHPIFLKEFHSKIVFKLNSNSITVAVEKNYT